ncbi:uncharacterized protein LOC118434220 [Folsomia candida]|uniref:Chitin-binding type-2 domain-containing protein n=1 Tax=Folsomia candida TaxID=158441 RepID=A0A226EWD1_FOLCA|nr:uncharacterized protein LOC118434220 [Folsomia candida]OXA61151.1 hypothetical protein Fcan01_04835 [Folsomia candida]
MKSSFTFKIGVLLLLVTQQVTTSRLPPPEDDVEEEQPTEPTTGNGGDEKLEKPEAEELKEGEPEAEKAESEQPEAEKSDAETPKESEGQEPEEEEEELRGLRGQANPLAALHQSAVKCATRGSYGVKNECSKYIECRKQGAITATRYCPSGKFFDHFKRVCMFSGDAFCKDTCPQDGVKFVDPSDHKGWLECVNGVPMPKPCRNGEVYSQSSMRCEHDAEEYSDGEYYDDE